MDKKFEYTYSAATEEERGEIENIRSRYLPQKKVESGLERLRLLDEKVKKPPLICALIIGIAGTLIFGLGLTMATEWNNLTVGIILGVIGAAIITLNPFIYKKLLAARKKKYGEEILVLSAKLLQKKEPKEEETNE